MMMMDVRRLEEKIAKTVGVPHCALVAAGEGETVLLRAMMARELGERAIARGDEVILVGAICGAEKAALSALGVVGICVAFDGGAEALESTLSPASRAVWVCGDAATETVCMVRNLCNSLDLWMLATVSPQDTRACVFDGKHYHVGAVADVATGAVEGGAFVCTKDALPYRLMLAVKNAITGNL